MIIELSDLLPPSDRKQLIKECFGILRELLHTPNQSPEFRRRTAEGILKYLVPKARHPKDPPDPPMTKEEVRERKYRRMTQGMAKLCTCVQRHYDEQKQLAEEALKPETGTSEAAAQEKEPHVDAALEEASNPNPPGLPHGKMPRSS